MNRVEEAYRIERELARRLRSAPKERRTRVARTVYTELYRRVHWHPDLSRTPEERRARSAETRFAYERWIADADSILEIGAGGCDLLAELGRQFPETRFAGIDLARAPLASSHHELPGNVRFVQAAASEIPFRAGTFDFVYCSQVLEHFHPDDVVDHLREVARVLRPGGWLGFDTPNRLTGPHDISRGFTAEATGLHLKEWTYDELVGLLDANGFDRILTRALPGRIARILPLPPPGPLIHAAVRSGLERIVGRAGRTRMRRSVARLFGLDGIYLYARREG